MSATSIRRQKLAWMKATSVTHQQRAKMEEKNGRGGEMPEDACGGERKRSGADCR